VASDFDGGSPDSGDEAEGRRSPCLDDAAAAVCPCARDVVARARALLAANPPEDEDEDYTEAEYEGLRNERGDARYRYWYGSPRRPCSEPAR
jgi:hypothetical protein